MKIYSTVELIGDTPHLRLKALFPDHEIWIKLEQQNPGGSIKDRISVGMIEAAENQGTLLPGGTIIEATSGNTGIGLALVGAIKGYQVKIVMPASQSIERRNIIRAYGADLILTPKEDGIEGAIKKAHELRAEIPDSVMMEQFSNTANPAAHKNTAREIADDFKHLDYLFAGFGTGGHISTVSDLLKQQFKTLKTVAVDPAGAPTLSQGGEGSHSIPGIGPGFIPDNLLVESIDEVIQVSDAEAFSMTRRIVKEEGLFTGISTGAVLAAINKKINDDSLRNSDVVLTFSYDTGERYLSIEGLFV